MHLPQAVQCCPSGYCRPAIHFWGLVHRRTLALLIESHRAAHCQEHVVAQDAGRLQHRDAPALELLQPLIRAHLRRQ